MEEALWLIIELGLVILLVLANGYFVAAEFAIVRSQPTKLRTPEWQGKFGVKASLRLIEEIDQSLSSTQLGITIASLMLGWWGEHVFQLLFINWFAALGEPLSFYLSHAVATACALVVITYLHVVLGELAAKSLAIRYPETTLRYLADGMLLFTRAFSPLLSVLNASANLFLRIFGITAQAESERALSGAEIAMLVTRSTAGGLLDKGEEEMIHGVFEFSQTVAREVMTPRTDLITIPVDASLEDVMSQIVTSGLSRFPVIEGRVDNVVGLLLARDVLPQMCEKILSGKVDFDLRKIMREPYFVPNTKPIDDLLSEFKKRKLHMAIVLDEHGGVDGVVTLEDLLEEIVGEIFDESDEAEVYIEVRDDGEILLDGSVPVDEINNRFPLQIPDGDYDTVAGFVMTTLGQVPEQGSRVFLGNGQAWSEQEYEQLHEPPEDQSLNGESTHEDDDEDEKEAVAVITVSSVCDHRIEALQLSILDNVSESIPLAATSQPASVQPVEKIK